jgi:hypothetical protein
MNYSKIISYIYALLAVGYGTFFCITYIYSELVTINDYNSRKETIGIIKTIYCHDKSTCHADIEYIVNNTKYLLLNKISKNLKIGDKIEVRYIPDNPNDALVYGNMHIYSYIYVSLLIILIIILWILLLIVIAFPSIYNKYIFLNYAIFVTINITFVWYINMNNSLHEYYVYCINADHYNNYDYYYDNYYYYDDNFQNNTIGIIKSQDEKYSYVEYFIDDVKYNVKLLPLDFKVGQEVKVFYNKDNHEAIKIYDNTEKNKELINIIIGLFVLLLLWIFLFYNIPLILN